LHCVALSRIRRQFPGFPNDCHFWTVDSQSHLFPGHVNRLGSLGARRPPQRISANSKRHWEPGNLSRISSDSAQVTKRFCPGFGWAVLILLDANGFCSMIFKSTA